MNHAITATVVLTELMNLGMTIVAAGNAIVCAGCHNLIIFQAPIFQTRLLKSGLQKTTPPAAAIIIGAVGCHIDEIFLTDNGFDHKAQIFGNGISIAFAHDLTRILNRKLDL